MPRVDRAAPVGLKADLRHQDPLPGEQGQQALRGGTDLGGDALGALALGIEPRWGREGASGQFRGEGAGQCLQVAGCLLYTSPSPRDGLLSRMPSSA